MKDKEVEFVEIISEQSESDQESFSLSFLDSDNIINQRILTMLVGTLVKPDLNGRLVPSLAKNWIESEDQKTWKFIFHKDGDNPTGWKYVSPVSFREKLIENIKRVKTASPNFWYSDLKGWAEFQKGNEDAIGITASEEALTFSFVHNPDQFLEKMAMPYFGYWTDENDLKDALGPYEIFENSPPRIELKLKSVFEQKFPNAPRRVVFTSRKVKLDEFSSKNIIGWAAGSIRDNLVEKNIRHNSFSPDLLVALIVNPLGHQDLEEEKFRQDFSNIFWNEIGKNSSQKLKGRLHRTFFLDEKNKFFSTSQNFSTAKSRKKIRVGVPADWALGKYVVDGIVASLKKLNAEFVVEEIDYADEAQSDLYSDNKTYNIRIAYVDSGARYSNSVVEMMFCTELGVRFPDYDGTVCRLVKEYKESKSPNLESYRDRLNAIVAKESYVIPYYRDGGALFFSESLKLKDFPTGAYFIDFSKMEFVD